MYGAETVIRLWNQFVAGSVSAHAATFIRHVDAAHTIIYIHFIFYCTFNTLALRPCLATSGQGDQHLHPLVVCPVQPPLHNSNSNSNDFHMHDKTI